MKTQSLLNRLPGQATNDSKMVMSFFYNNPEFEDLNSDTFFIQRHNFHSMI